MNKNESIVALATPNGSGAIGVIRVSGHDSIEKVAPLFFAKNKKQLTELASHSLTLGFIKDGERILDEVLVSIFKGSRSYTGEPTIEISCHGSNFILKEIIQLLIRNGVRAAEPGEFTLRSFINGKMDLSQAEAVADLIASENEASHQLAMQQMRGGFSNELKDLRSQLLNFASLIELELDFAEEDVEFANRDEFQALVMKIQKTLQRLIDSFAIGNVLKKGIPVAIVGEPNVGKSTLLNALLNEERAIVSDIAGTTRDTIEDEIAIKGIGFRFIDTAGIRETTDAIEGLGIQKTFEKIEQSQLVIQLIDSTRLFENHRAVEEKFKLIKDAIQLLKEKYPNKPFILITNKIDRLDAEQQNQLKKHFPEAVGISAKARIGLERIEKALLNLVDTGALQNQDAIVTNSRHYQALLGALQEINSVQEGLNANLSTDLLAIDIRQCLYHIGEITGEVTNDEILGNIFANFCIGK